MGSVLYRELEELELLLVNQELVTAVEDNFEWSSKDSFSFSVSSCFELFF